MPPAPPGQPADLPRPPARVTSPRGGVGRGLAAWVGRSGSPAEPWLADAAWRRDGADDESGRDARRALVAGGIVTAIGSVVGAVFLSRAPSEMVVVPALVVGVFLLAGFWFLGVGVVTVLRRQRHGVVELRFGRFPHFLGEPLDVTLVRRGATVPLPGLHARLTCVEEYWGHPEDEPHTSMKRRLERRDGWSETRPVRGTFGAMVPIRFDLPPPGPGVHATALSAELPTYWELELWAELPGPDFQAVFLVPVYQRPGAP